MDKLTEKANITGSESCSSIKQEKDGYTKGSFSMENTQVSAEWSMKTELTTKDSLSSTKDMVKDSWSPGRTFKRDNGFGTILNSKKLKKLKKKK